MGALNSKGRAPFLTYLTVFKSRLAVSNVVLPLAGFAYQPAATLSRRLKHVLSEMVDLDLADPAVKPVLEYLIAKKLVGTSQRNKGRYTEYSLDKVNGWKALDRHGSVLSRISVFRTDVWMADPALQSTVGVPTVENSDELLELCFQLGLLSKSKSTWTAAGQLTTGLRTLTPGGSANPLALGLEAMALLRQVIEADGLLLREILREAASLRQFSRDGMALKLAAIAQHALSAAQTLRLPPPVLAEGKRFVALVAETSEKRASASRAPGVLEHRITPRLEWLTDFGALTKANAPKNSFDYSVTPDASKLMSRLEGDPGAPHWADDAALGYWRTSSHWSQLRRGLSGVSSRRALQQGYKLMQRSVGPTSIREVSFAAGVLMPLSESSLRSLSDELVSWAAEERAITVSGGRYSRKPELVHMAADVLVEG